MLPGFCSCFVQTYTVFLYILFQGLQMGITVFVFVHQKALRSKNPRRPDRRSTPCWKSLDRCAQTFGESQLNYFFSTTEAFSTLVVFLPQGFFSLLFFTSEQQHSNLPLQSSFTATTTKKKEKRKTPSTNQSPVQKRKLLTQNCRLTSKCFGLWITSLCKPWGRTWRTTKHKGWSNQNASVKGGTPLWSG